MVEDTGNISKNIKEHALEDLGEGMLLNTELVAHLSNNNVKQFKTNELFNKELQFQKDTLKCLIDKKISFCALVSGFRGTGKSVFVDYAMNECSDNENIIFVKFNSMKYDSYQNFINQSIRQLYIAVKDKHIEKYDISNLQKLYLSTFYDVKEMADITKNDSSSNVDSFDKGISVNRDVSINEILLLILASALNKDFWGRILTIGLAIIGKIGLKIVSSRNVKSEHDQQAGSSYSFKCESIYDSEISSYYFEEELSRLKALNKNIIFIIDELDKLDNTKVSDILSDLKPLLLSNYCNAILVGGINFEEELFSGKAGMNSVGSGIFNRRFYIPLASMNDLLLLSQKMMADNFEALSESEALPYINYFRVKAIESRGVKRTFVNSIISAARGLDKLYLLKDELENYVIQHEELLGYFDAINEFNDLMAQNYTDADYLIMDTSIQYALYYIQLMIASEELPVAIAETRKKLDEYICENDIEFIKRILSENQRLEIIEQFDDILQSIKRNSEAPKTLIDTSFGTGKSHNYANVVGRLFNITETWENDFDFMIADFVDSNITLTKEEIKNLKDIYRLVYFFGRLLDKTMEEFCSIYLENLLDGYSFNIFESEESAIKKLFIFIYRYQNCNLRIIKNAESLLKLWYSISINNSKTVNQYAKFNSPQVQYKGLDFIDLTRKNAFDVKYYKSNSYFNRYKDNIVKDTKKAADSIIKDTTLNKVALIVFLVDAAELTSTIISTNDYDYRIIPVNLRSYDSFKVAMDNLHDYFI